jgi:hypothetical protein
MTGVLPNNKAPRTYVAPRSKGKGKANDKAAKQQKGAGKKDAAQQKEEAKQRQQQEEQQKQQQQQQLREQGKQEPDQEADADSKQGKVFMFNLRRQKQAAGEVAAAACSDVDYVEWLLCGLCCLRSNICCLLCFGKDWQMCSNLCYLITSV